MLSFITSTMDRIQCCYMVSLCARPLFPAAALTPRDLQPRRSLARRGTATRRERDGEAVVEMLAEHKQGFVWSIVSETAAGEP